MQTLATVSQHAPARAKVDIRVSPQSSSFSGTRTRDHLDVIRNWPPDLARSRQPTGDHAPRVGRRLRGCSGVAEIFRFHGPLGARSSGALSLGQLKVESSLEHFRARAGGHFWSCRSCEPVQIAYTHAAPALPECRPEAARRWLEALSGDLLPDRVTTCVLHTALLRSASSPNQNNA